MIIVTYQLNIPDFIGRFHPLLVHLPIGILLLSALLYRLSKKEKYASLNTATGIALFWGMISAILSCISGYYLSGSGDYDEQLVSRHQWMGIATAILSLIVYLFHRWENGLEKWLMVILVLSIIITGHLGGSLTHGSNYLFAVNKDSDKLSEKEIKPIADVQEAEIYSGVVQPLLESRCYSCHNKTRKKGGLRLDEPSFIMKGGKDGEVIKPGDAAESDMIKRLLLPRNDDDHMPPKEKPQLKENEIALLHWWVSTGASFDKKVKELDQPEKIKPILLALQKPVAVKMLPDVPAVPVSPGDEKIILQLKQAGVVLVPVSRSSNYLSANFITADSVTAKEMSLLLSLKKQLVWLKLSRKKINDEMMSHVAGLTGLTRLQLDSTQITNKGLTALRALKNLQYLNLVGTKVTADGILELKELKNLQALYLYKTNTGMNDWGNLKNTFPNTLIDTGGYAVPLLQTDTMEVKPPVKKKE
jgi:uncharacterized membrane protein/mono/diheme cytochrome c family protein